MALKDVRSYQAQWTEHAGGDAALPPPITARVWLTGTIRALHRLRGDVDVADGTLGGGHIRVVVRARGVTMTTALDLVPGAVRAIARLTGVVTDLPPAFTLSLSAFIDASGEDTTAMLTPPSGKTTADFQAGRIQDDENPADSINLGGDKYTELEWCIVMTDDAEEGEEYEFRVAVA